jgi:hypothetical protein
MPPQLAIIAKYGKPGPGYRGGARHTVTVPAPGNDEYLFRGILQSRSVYRLTYQR